MRVHRTLRSQFNPTLRFIVDPNLDGTAGVVTPRTFTQEEVTALAAREKDQGRVAGLREATEKLGGRTIDDAAALIAAAVAADEANKTDAQRELAAATAAKTQAEAEKAEAAKDRAEAAKDRHAARVERLLTGAVDVDVAARALDVPIGADEATVKAAIDALKVKVPGLFGAPVVIPNTDAGKPPVGGAAGTSAADRAAEIAKSRWA